ncbi:two-component system sporulation sensor kinase B [Bacillus fengqiuensis]|nr:two-component system sporulation sensor kinase B [Bacillus fengqiuensis]
MKEFSVKDEKNLKVYRIFIAVAGLLMLAGLFITFFEAEKNKLPFIIHAFFAAIVFVVLILYPKRESEFLKGMLISFVTVYFYVLFFLFPQTSSMITLISILPAAAIIIFHKKIFWILAAFNLVGGTSLIWWVAQYGPAEKKYAYLAEDVVGNLINFWASQILLAFIFFITLKRMEKLRQYHQEIQRTERLHSVGQLAASIAHEIRNPLTVVRGFLQLFQEKPSFTENEKEYLRQMILEVDHTQAIISDFLSLAKPDIYHIEMLDLKQQIEQVIDLLSSYALLNNIEFHTSLEDSLHIRANTIELKQVLINLMKNAIEAMDAMEKEGTITVRSRQNDRFVIIDIADTGLGMSPEEMKRLGTPFYSLKDRGTGIGLMVCYNIIEKYKGKIEVESTKGQGTQFSVFIPKAEA